MASPTTLHGVPHYHKAVKSESWQHSHYIHGGGNVIIKIYVHLVQVSDLIHLMC